MRGARDRFLMAMRRHAGASARAVLGAIMVVAFAVVAWPVSARAAGPAWVVNGSVHTIVHHGALTYIGGDFISIAPRTGPAVALSAATGDPVPGYPILVKAEGANIQASNVAGTVETVISDGAGGWYLGGSFTRVGTTVRRGLAHVLADGSLAPDFRADQNGTVWTLALALDGSTLFVGGDFSVIGGQVRHLFAALDAQTGAPRPFDPQVSGGRVDAIAVSGSRVYLGGGFYQVSGQYRYNVAALDLPTLTLSPWYPGVVQGGVAAIAVGQSRVYLGGDFITIDGQWRQAIAAADEATGHLLSWNPGQFGTGQVSALVLDGGTLYVGGRFSAIAGVGRHNVAALDAPSGAATPWDPDVRGDWQSVNGDGSLVDAIALRNGTVYLGGIFRSVGGTPRLALAAVSSSSGAPTAWNPTPWGAVTTIAASGQVVYVGGRFISAGGVQRRNIAAVDDGGAPTGWDPEATWTVESLAVSPDGRTVYAGGAFDHIGGQDRDAVAVLDATTGAATAFNAGPMSVNRRVHALAQVGSTLYIAGSFETIAGVPRTGLAAVDAATGALTPWDPHPNSMGSPGNVWSLLLAGSTIYAGGTFDAVGGARRQNLAALSATTGLATGFAADADYLVRSLALADGVLYVGGNFGHIGGATRNGLAALDALTGTLSAWDPQLQMEGGTPAGASDLAVDGSTLYAVGQVMSIGGFERYHLVAIDRQTGKPSAWAPQLFGFVDAVAIDGQAVYAGGEFDRVGGLDSGGYVRLDKPLATPATGVELPRVNLILHDPVAPEEEGVIELDGYAPVPAGLVLFAISDRPDCPKAADLPTTWSPTEALIVNGAPVLGDFKVEGAFRFMPDTSYRICAYALDQVVADTTFGPPFPLPAAAPPTDAAGAPGPADQPPATSDIALPAVQWPAPADAPTPDGAPLRTDGAARSVVANEIPAATVSQPSGNRSVVYLHHPGLKIRLPRRIRAGRPFAIDLSLTSRLTVTGVRVVACVRRRCRRVGILSMRREASANRTRVIVSGLARGRQALSVQATGIGLRTIARRAVMVR
jgi:beta-propeller uncharacterized protein DUF5122